MTLKNMLSVLSAEADKGPQEFSPYEVAHFLWCSLTTPEKATLIKDLHQNLPGLVKQLPLDALTQLGYFIEKTRIISLEPVLDRCLLALKNSSNDKTIIILRTQNGLLKERQQLS